MIFQKFILPPPILLKSSVCLEIISYLYMPKYVSTWLYFCSYGGVVSSIINQSETLTADLLHCIY